MKNKSLDEGLNVILQKPACSRWDSESNCCCKKLVSETHYKEEQLAADGESSCSKRVNQNLSREDINAERGEHFTCVKLGTRTSFVL